MARQPRAAKARTANKPRRKGTDSPIARLKDGAGDLREKAGRAATDAREKAYRAADETNRIFQEHPVAALAAAAAAGAVIGIFLPKVGAASRAARIAGVTGSRAGTLAGRTARLVAGAETARAILGGISDMSKAARTAAQKSAGSAMSAARTGADAARAAAHVGSEAAKEGIAHLPSARQVRKRAEKVGEDVAGAARRAAQATRKAIQRD